MKNTNLGDATHQARPVPKTSSSERFHYLDTLRGLLMSIGIVLHAGIIVEDRQIPAAIHYTSNLFRMELFILIAGFFAALVVNKKGERSATYDRLIRIGVPCLFFIVFINPITGYFLHLVHVGPVPFLDFITPGHQLPADAPNYINWYIQLWFLVVLLIHSVLIPLVMPLARKLAHNSVTQAITELKPLWGFFVLAAIMIVTTMAAKTFHQFVIKDHFGSFNFIVYAALWYLPFFILGAAAFINRRLFDILHCVQWIHVILAVVAIAVYQPLADYIEANSVKAIASLVRNVAEGYIGVVICASLLSIFKRFFSHSSTLGGLLSEASYTVFLMHVVVISIVDYVFLSLGMGKIMVYLTSMLVTYIICLAFHFLAVKKSSVLTLVVNGKKPVSKARASKASSLRTD